MSGQTLCDTVEPGYFVNESGAVEQEPCPAGKFSIGGKTECTSSQCPSFLNFGSASTQVVPRWVDGAVQWEFVVPGVSVAIDDDGNWEYAVQRMRRGVLLELCVLERHVRGRLGLRRLLRAMRRYLSHRRRRGWGVCALR